MSSQKSLLNTDNKIEEVERRIENLHFEENSCLRVIAEKMVCWKYFELSDEFKALKFVISVLKKEGVTWSRGQIRRALRYCFDPRYYYRQSMEDVYELAGIERIYIPQVLHGWTGITEWQYPEEEEESENWHARRVRIGSSELSDEKREYLRGRKR